MSYPPPPWTLKGYALQTLQMLEIDSVNYQPGNWNLPLNLSLPGFGILGSDVLRFQANFKSNLSLINSDFNISSESPFANLVLEKPGLTLSLNNLILCVSEPKKIK